MNKKEIKPVSVASYHLWPENGDVLETETAYFAFQ